jgi:hypothetical protein
MAEPIYTTRPQAILAISQEPMHIPEGIVTLYRINKALGDSGDDIIPDADLTAQKVNIDKLNDKQQGMKDGPSDKTTSRNKAYGVCFADHRADMLKVQMAADQIDDFNEAASLIKRNGFDIKKQHAPLLSPEIAIWVKKGAERTVVAEVKAPNTKKRFAIDWWISYEGENYQPAYPTAICKRDFPNIPYKATVTVKARYVIGNTPPSEWMYSNEISF